MKRLNPFEQESGNFWDEPLDLYKGGIININCYENVIGYEQGECISGTVDIQINEPFPAKDLIISFVGIERSHLDASHTEEPLDFHRENIEVIHVTSTLDTFDENNQLPPGQYTYYFLVKLPEWLPESTVLKTESCKFFMEYTLRAQFTPMHQCDFAQG